MFRARGSWSLIGLAAGCSGSAVDDPGTAALASGGAALSPAFAMSPAAPAAAHIVPRGEGVALALEGLASNPLVVTTTGLGAVTRAATDAAGAVNLEHPEGVEERWQPVALGAEQSWRYARRPARGSVTVSVSFDGATLDHADAEALWLRTSTGSLVRYSHATWVGADGARTPVPARWTGDRIAIEVPDEVVARTRFPAVLDPTVSLPVNLSPSRAQALPGSLVTSPAVVVETTTSTLLLKLARLRQSTYGLLTVQALDPAGAPVPGSFRGVPATAFGIYSVNTLHFAAASYGTGVLTAATSQTPGYHIIAARLRPTGEPVDAAPSSCTRAPTSTPTRVSPARPPPASSRGETAPSAACSRGASASTAGCSTLPRSSSPTTASLWKWSPSPTASSLRASPPIRARRPTSWSRG